MARDALTRTLRLPAAARHAILNPKTALLRPTFTTIPSRHFATPTPALSSPPPTASQSSVNDTEVSHFNALASSWWDPHGSSRLLHLMNPLRHDFIKQCLSRSPPSSAAGANEEAKPLKFLDIGCGGGIFAESAARLGLADSVTAIDPTPEVIAVARRHQREDPLLMETGPSGAPRLRYLNTPIEGLGEYVRKEESFDIVTLFEVIEHIQRPSPFLTQCLRQLKPGGWLIGSTIARTNVSWFTTKFVAEEVIKMVPRGTHDWNQYIQPHELQTWAKAQAELSAIDGHGWNVMGVVYVPGIGWKEVKGSETWGNYFFAMQKRS